ncbi:MAG: thioredoxin family protein, partial [Bacteroidota bacterium]
MMKKFWSLALLAISVLLLNGGFRPADSPPPAKEEINWISVEEAAALSAQDGKKLIIDLYTDWCGWCKRMDRDTYAKAEVIRYINEHYHAVKFNAEQKESVTVGG